MSAVIGLHQLVSKCQAVLATSPISSDRPPRSSNFCIFDALLRVEISVMVLSHTPVAVRRVAHIGVDQRQE